MATSRALPTVIRAIDGTNHNMQTSTRPHKPAQAGQLPQMLDLLPTGALAFDPQTGFHWNQHAEELLGIRGVAGHVPSYRHELRTEDGTQVLAHELVLSALTGRRSASPREVLLAVHQAGDTLRWIAMTSSQLEGTPGTVCGAIAIFHALPAKTLCGAGCPVASRLQAEVRQRENVLSAVLHDLRGPLQSLMLQSWNIEDAAYGTAGGAHISELASAIRYLCQFTADLLDDLVAQAVPGGLSPAKLRFAHVSPRDLIRLAREQASPILANRGVQLALEVQPNLPTLRADVPRLLRAFCNLLENASKFTQPGGLVKLGAEASGTNVRFWICNSGAPVPQSEIDRMFTPFWKAAENTAGIGLGMAICKSIVEAHGGSVWAEAAPGMRLCVNVVLQSVQEA